tara:strand:+ start:1173 stop:1442 length:270 start_codon:yes stop_codon:yes gene_type:complete
MPTTVHILATETLRLDPHGVIQLTAKCPITDVISLVNVYAKEWREWLSSDSDRLIQDIFPFLDGDQLELILTGTTAAGWDILFPPHEEY